MYYNEKTGFITHETVVLNKIYVKNENDTVGIINVSDNWKMEGQMTNPVRFPWCRFPLYWNQETCEGLLVIRTPPNRGEEMLKQIGIEKYDTMMILYTTRGIQLMDKMWFAWSESDKGEDYHPLMNKRLLEENYKELKCYD